MVWVWCGVKFLLGKYTREQTRAVNHPPTLGTSINVRLKRSCRFVTLVLPYRRDSALNFGGGPGLAKGAVLRYRGLFRSLNSCSHPPPPPQNGVKFQ